MEQDFRRKSAKIAYKDKDLQFRTMDNESKDGKKCTSFENKIIQKIFSRTPYILSSQDQAEVNQSINK